jgi:cyanophycin synthetase
LVTFALEHHSAGRANLFAVHGGYVLVDYGHNPAALQALGRTVSQWGASRVTQVLAVPGDRADSLLVEAARAVSGVDRVIVREDDDLRGRQPGEVAELLRSALLETQPELHVRIIRNELEAVGTAVNEMEPGEVVVALCERVQDVTDWLMTHDANPVTSFQTLAGSGAGRPQSAA